MRFSLTYIVYWWYSLTSPYGQLYNTDTSPKRTLGSVPLVSVLKRFDSTSLFYHRIAVLRISSFLSYIRAFPGWASLQLEKLKERGRRWEEATPLPRNFQKRQKA